ncbi:multidrug-resistance transporte [Scheffersomyces coipomensis]|uniref:multidrug-resistance transporte n=1 Tax=Scheffersomyces coipomensis TaxID=1788519 RepID=UPI00315D0240
MTDQEAQIPKPDKKNFIESDAGDGTKREDQYLTGPKLILCFISVFLCMFLAALDQTIVVTILSTVGNKFDSFSKVGWLSSGFMLTSAVFIQVYGKLSIMIGRKYTMLIAVLIFEAGSLMCGLSNNMNTLIGGRVLGGIGAAGIQTLSLVIITEILPIQKRPLGIAVISLVFAVASIVGPLIGGALTTRVSWRWCFFINLPIGGIAAVFLWFAFNPPVPKSNLIEELKKYDYFGTFLMISGFVVFLLALTFGGVNYPWGSAPVILCFVLGGVTIIAFVIWNIYFSKNKLFPNEITKVPQIIAAVISIGTMFAYFMGIIIFAALYFQVIHDASAMGSGLHILPLLISFVLTSVISSVIIQKTRYVKPITIFSGILGPIGAGLVCLLKVDSSFAAQVGLLIVSGIALGSQMQSAVISAQIMAPKTPGSTIMVTSLIGFSRSMGGTVGADLGDMVYSTSLKNLFLKAIKAETNAEILSELAGINISELVSDNSFISKLSPITQQFVKLQVMNSLRNVFYMCIGFACIATVSNIFITNKRLPSANITKKTGDDEEKKVDGEEEEEEEVTVDEDGDKEQAVASLVESIPETK